MKILDTAEAVRRIQERDHSIAPGQQMDFEQEQELICMLQDGYIKAALLPDGQLAFSRSDDA